MTTRLWLSIAALGCAAFTVAQSARAAIGDPVSAALADLHRPAAQIKLDNTRKPVQVITFAGIGPGDRMADFMPGNAYFTRIFSKLVGPTGRVYAFTPREQIQRCDPSETAGARAIEHDPAYRNVVHLSGPVDHFTAPEKLDVIWIAQNYHDLHDAFLGPADVRRVNKNFFDALKPGGVLIVIDHAAASGTGLQKTEQLHRIDPRSVREEVEAAGFVFEADSDDLQNAADDHLSSVFDPGIRGRTDQFVYKFRKPGRRV